MQDRKEYIDIAKGLCIILVVLGHILQYNYTGKGAESAFNFIYSFHMPVFMMLSGFVVAFSRDTLDVTKPVYFVKKKITSLILPYLIWGAVITPFIMNNWDSSNYISYIARLVTNPLMGAWFIAVLFSMQMFYLLFCYLSSLSNRLVRNKLVCEILCGVGTLLLIGIIEFILKRHNIESSFYFSTKYFIFFLSGYFTSRYLTHVLENKWCVACTILLFSFLSSKFVFNNTNDLIVVILGLTAFAIVINLSTYIDKLGNCKILSVFGRESLSIYLMHYTFVQFITDGNGGGYKRLFKCRLIPFVANTIYNNLLGVRYYRTVLVF